MQNKIVWLKIENKNYYYILMKLNEIEVNIYDIKKDKDNIYIKTNLDDYKRIKKYLVSKKVTIYKKSGILKGEEILKKYFIFFLSSVLSIIILILANHVIFKIEVKTPNKEVESLVLKELNARGIKRLTFKKNHKKIEKIVNQILDDNKDTLEWLEIKYEGLILVVNVTEKINFAEEKEEDNCDIISRTDGKIISLNLYRGVALKEINDYVTKGEVIISGSIVHNEEVKDTVCAQGEVYGEVWYKVKVTVPFEETYLNYTGKNRYNLALKLNDKEYDIFKSRIEKKKKEIIPLYTLNDFSINLVKEKEYVMSKRVLREKEAYEKGIELAVNKINLKLAKDEEILLKKVLKKEANNSTIYLEVFIVTKENVGVLKKIEGENLDDTKINIKNNE